MWLSNALITSVTCWLQLNFLLKRLIPTYNSLPDRFVAVKIGYLSLLSDGLTNYTFFSTGETHPIKSNLACETKNLIYMIQRNRWNLQYMGETKRRLKDRFNEHRRTTDNPNSISKPTTVAEHFLSTPNNTANDMQLIPIENFFSQARLTQLVRPGSHFNLKRQKNWSSWP